jgi:hypothetical protein
MNRGEIIIYQTFDGKDLYPSVEEKAAKKSAEFTFVSIAVILPVRKNNMVQ